MFFKDVEYFTHTLSKISPKMHVLESGIIFYNYLLGFSRIFLYYLVLSYRRSKYSKTTYVIFNLGIVDKL